MRDENNIKIFKKIKREWIGENRRKEFAGTGEGRQNWAFWKFLGKQVQAQRWNGWNLENQGDLR